jgi:GT2 family glycosyltransferase
MTPKPEGPVKVVVSIINYRTAELTIRCVESVVADLAGLDGCVTVVDNASGDGSVDRIEAWINEAAPPVPVRLIRSAVNTGFSGGHNIGIGSCEAEFYLVLNSDAELRRGFLRAMLAAAEADPTTGLFAPQLEGENAAIQDSCFRFPSPTSEFIRGAASGPVAKILRRRVVSLGPLPEPLQIEWASFACILLRGTMLREIGPMDEGYFLYFEDVDYCMQARRGGWRIRHVPEARAIHFRGGSGPVKALARQRARLPAYYYASRTRFFYRAHGWVGLLAANFAWIAGRSIARLRMLAGKPVPQATKGEVRDIWTNFFTPLGPRHAPGERG